MGVLADLAARLAAADPVASGRLLAAADAGLAAAEPTRLTERALMREPGGMRVRRWRGDRLVKCRGAAALAVGKAALGMAEGADRALGGLISRGLAVCDQPGPVPGWARLAVGEHPAPGEGSAGAGRAALELVETVREDEVLLALVSAERALELCASDAEPAPLDGAESGVVVADAELEENLAALHRARAEGGRARKEEAFLKESILSRLGFDAECCDGVEIRRRDGTPLGEVSAASRTSVAIADLRSSYPEICEELSRTSRYARLKTAG